MAPRGRGGKFSKPTRGGGKHYSRDLQPLDKDGHQMGMWRDPADGKKSDVDSESEEDESSEEESGDEGPSTGSAAQAKTREQRKEEQRKKKAAAVAAKQKKTAAVGDMPTDSEEEEEEEEESSEDEGEVLANPNHSTKARAQARAVTGVSGETPLPSRKDKGNLSRREKEAIAAQQAKERYQKLHAEGKTDEARADLARLRLIKQQREEAAARKAAEKEEIEARAQENKERLEREEKLRAKALGDAAPKKKGLKGRS